MLGCRKWAVIFLAPFALTVAGCYGPQNVRDAKIVYSAEAERPPIELGRCFQNRHLLDRDVPLEFAEDESTGEVRVTLVIRNPYGLYGGVWHWEAMLSPNGHGSRVVLRSNSSIWGPMADDGIIRMIEQCAEP